MEYLFLNLLFNSALASTQPGVIPILPPDVFSWAIGIGLLLALGSIIYAGIMYMVSAGNQSYQKESMERIKGTVFGLILLISSWLILYTLNPEILRTGAIKIPAVQLRQPTRTHNGFCCQPSNLTQICRIDRSKSPPTCDIDCKPCSSVFNPAGLSPNMAIMCVEFQHGAECDITILPQPLTPIRDPEGYQ